MVLNQPAVLVTVLTGVAMLPWFLGLLLVGPVVGHASWHAYRTTVIDEDSDEADTSA
jgi:uncharacterized membrane protein